MSTFVNETPPIFCMWVCRGCFVLNTIFLDLGVRYEYMVSMELVSHSLKGNMNKDHHCLPSTNFF